MKIHLENSTSLISLNLDIQFKCNDIEELFKSLESGDLVSQPKQDDSTTPKPETKNLASKRLGLFSV